MRSIRRHLFRELAITFGVMTFALLVLAALSTFLPVPDEPALRILVMVATLMAFLAICVGRFRRLTRSIGDPLEALAHSARLLGQGQVPEPVVTDLEEIDALDGALRRAGESLKVEAELRLQLERSQRLETLGTLAGGIAHDVNNQLASIVGQINLGIEGLPEGHPVRRRLDKAEEAANRCALMIKSLLGFTHQVKPQLRSVDLNAVIGSTATLLDRVLGGLIRIEPDLDPNLPLILGEPVQLEQILMNLAINARDAMPQGGRLTLRTRRSEPGWVSLVVRDTGTGIDPDVLPRIFEPYFTTKELGKGSGLGLSMVLSLVKGHGGRIAVSSHRAVGTEFRLSFCIHEGEPNPLPDPAGKAAPALHFAGRRILLAEDDPNLRELLADAFTQARAQVETAPDGETAWNLFRQSRYDLVISDQRMPGCTGLQLLERIRRTAPEMPVLLVSGYGLEGVEEELARDPWLRYLVKPFPVHALFAEAASMLEDCVGV